MKAKLLIILFVFASTSLFAKNLYKNVNIDLYGGYGQKKLHGADFENALGQPDFYGSIRLGYNLSKRFQIETGFSSNRYGSYEYWNIDNERYFGSTYMARYRNIPMLFRIRPYKSWWIGAGAQYSMLKWGKLYPSYQSEDYTDITTNFNTGVWNAYFDVRLVYENVGLGMNYTRSVTPVRNDFNDWSMSYFNIYISVNINEMLKRIVYKYL
jgi:hypothetical protein